MNITVEFDPPQPGDSREVFNSKAFDTVAKFNPWSQQANALALEVNDDAATAEAGAEIVNAVVNFRGPWDDLTGALSVPASCSHASGYWILLESVADVTAHEPGVSAVWAMYESDFARLSGADFTGPITVPAGASGAQVPQAQEVAPPGAVMMFARNSAPAGWLKANGSPISRAVYVDLFSAIGTTFGVGDGSTTFNLPDLRGEFPRFWSDGRAVDSGRVFGSAQAEGIGSHTHSLNIYTEPTGGSLSGGVADFATTRSGPQYGTASQTPTPTETRPRNIALLACIKY